MVASGESFADAGLTNRMERLDSFTDVRDIQASLEEGGLTPEWRPEPGSTGAGSITLVDPDGNPVLIDQFFSACSLPPYATARWGVMTGRPKTVVVTGVSTGIGRATAAELVAHGYHVFGSVRRRSDGDELSGQLAERFTPLVFDVTDRAAISAAAERVREAAGEAALAGLVNNAGVATFGPLMHLPVEDLRHQLEVNVLGLMEVTQAFLPLLGAGPEVAGPPGRIVNISSVSGRVAYPFMGAYAASKHAVEALSDVLRRELLPYGIDVVVIEPGTVDTPMVQKFAGQLTRFADTPYAPILRRIEGTVTGRLATALPVERVSGVVRTALESPRPKARYPLPRRRLSGWVVPRLLPDRWLDRLTARQLGLERLPASE